MVALPAIDRTIIKRRGNAYNELVYENEPEIVLRVVYDVSSKGVVKVVNNAGTGGGVTGSLISSSLSSSPTRVLPRHPRCLPPRLPLCAPFSQKMRQNTTLFWEA